MHAVWMLPLSQTWMCVTAACPFSRGVHPTAGIFLPSRWGGRARELFARILVQRNVFPHTQWLVMGTVRTTCNCSLKRALSLIMAACRSVEDGEAAAEMFFLMRAEHWAHFLIRNTTCMLTLLLWYLLIKHVLRALGLIICQNLEMQYLKFSRCE